MHKPFIISHLQKKLSAFPQMSGVVSVQHLPAVIFILYPQTEMKAGIAPDLVIDDPCRFLCAQQQMDAQTSSDAGNALQDVYKRQIGNRPTGVITE